MRWPAARSFAPGIFLSSGAPGEALWPPRRGGRRNGRARRDRLRPEQRPEHPQPVPWRRAGRAMAGCRGRRRPEERSLLVRSCGFPAPDQRFQQSPEPPSARRASALSRRRRCHGSSPSSAAAQNRASLAAATVRVKRSACPLGVRRGPDRWSGSSARPWLQSRSVFGLDLELAGPDAGRARPCRGGGFQGACQMRWRFVRVGPGDGQQPICEMREVGRLGSISGGGDRRPVSRRRSINRAAWRARKRPRAPPPPSPGPASSSSACRIHDIRSPLLSPLPRRSRLASVSPEGNRLRGLDQPIGVTRLPPPRLGTMAIWASWTGCSSPSYFTGMRVEFDPQLVDNARRKLKSTLLRIARPRYALAVAGRPQQAKELIWPASGAGGALTG